MFSLFDLYKLNIKTLDITIQGIKFTSREIDILACLISGRGRKKIASLLYISEKTVETHTRNIMRKLECYSQDHIRDVIEKSQTFSTLKSHYIELLKAYSFSQLTSKISFALKDNKDILILYKDVEAYKTFIKTLMDFFEKITFDISLLSLDLLSSIKTEQKLSQSSSVLYISPCLLEEKFYENQKVEHDIYYIFNKIKKDSSCFICIVPNFFQVKELYKDQITYLKCQNSLDIYDLFFTIIKKLDPHHEIEKLESLFKEEYSCFYEKDAVDQNPQTLSPFVYKKTKKSFNEISESIGFLKKILTYFLNKKVILSFFFVSTFLIFTSYKYNDLLDELTQKNTILSNITFSPSELNTHINRWNLIRKIEKHFTNPTSLQIVILTGLSGIGKTTLARKYATQHPKNLTWEINGTTQESVMQSYETLLFHLISHGADKKKFENIQKLKDREQRKEQLIILLKKMLRQQSSWFFIIDNVEKFSDIQKYIPYPDSGWGQGQVLITTKNSHIINTHIFSVIPIPPLTQEEKEKLFTKIMYTKNDLSNNLQRKKVQNFLKRLPSYPLDILHAAYYIKSTLISFDKYIQYLTDYSENFNKAQKKIVEGLNKNQNTRYTIISLIRDKIVQMHPDYHSLLILISLLDSEKIDRDMLNFFKDETIVDTFLQALQKYSLIHMSSHNKKELKTFSLHRDIQYILFKLLDLQIHSESLKDNEKKLIDYVSQFKKNQYSDTSKYLSDVQTLTVHLTSFLKKMPLSLSSHGILQGHTGDLYRLIGNFSKAEDLCHQAHQIILDHYGSNSTEEAWILGIMGNTYKDMGDYIKAENYLERSLQMYKKSQELAGIAEISMYLASICTYKGENSKAISLLNTSLTIYKKKDAQINHQLQIGWILSTLGSAYLFQGHYSLAEKTLKESIVHHKAEGSCMDEAWAMIHLAFVYRELESYEKAKKLLQENLKLYCKTYGEKDYRTGWVMMHLGDVDRLLGNHKKAEALCLDSYSIFEKLYGSHHIQAAWPLFYLGKIYKDSKRYTQALTALKKTLEIFKNHYGENHEIIGSLFHALGETYDLKEDYDLAQIFYEKAIKIHEKDPHPSHYKFFLSLGEFYLKRKSLQINNISQQKQREKALAYFKYAYKMVQASYPKDSILVKKIEKKLKTLLLT